MEHTHAMQESCYRCRSCAACNDCCPCEKTDSDFLNEVADKLYHLAPAVSGMDQYHSDRLRELATKVDSAWVVEHDHGVICVCKTEEKGKEEVEIYAKRNYAHMAQRWMSDACGPYLSCEYPMGNRFHFIRVREFKVL